MGWDMRSNGNMISFSRGTMVLKLYHDSRGRFIDLTSTTHKLDIPKRGRVTYAEDIICGRITLDRLSE